MRQPTSSPATETAVLIDGTVLRLSEVSATILTLTQNVVEVGRLAGELESRFGAPEVSTSLEATEKVSAQLISHGLLKSVRCADGGRPGTELTEGTLPPPTGPG